MPRTRLLPFRLLVLLHVWLAVTVAAQADVKLAQIFGSRMVLQRGMPVPVWGTADPNESVTIHFAGQKKSTKADQDGRWKVVLDPLQASSEGQQLRVDGQEELALTDILVGDVWICSGQSNMEWRMTAITNSKAEIEFADNEQIRLFNVPGHVIAPLPKDTIQGDWQVCSPDTVKNFSAVGYFFGRRLQNELDVPIGLVGSNWGGTRIEPWTSLDGFRSVPELKPIADEVAARTADSKVKHTQPSTIYNAMIHPLAPFAMKGAIWYQGESNGGEGESYYHKMQALINGWRKLFNPDLGFYWVQLANFRQPNDNPEGGDGWAKIREAQRKTLNMKHTGMAVIIDIGEANDIHPRNKQDVGSRLAQWALHQTYGQKDLVPSGPLFKSMKAYKNTIRLSFDHVGKGLMVGRKTGLSPTEEVKDGELKRFAIAGPDKKWHWATAKIDGDEVVVSSPEVPNPVAVRYAYSMNPTGANLYNKDGLPASPFRTDDW